VDRGRLKASLDDWRAWHARALERMRPRAGIPATPGTQALALVGLGRSGKTWLAVEAARRTGLRTLHFNFEDPLFYEDPSVAGLDALLSVHVEFEGA